MTSKLIPHAERPRLQGPFQPPVALGGGLGARISAQVIAVAAACADDIASELRQFAQLAADTAHLPNTPLRRAPAATRHTCITPRHSPTYETAYARSATPFVKRCGTAPRRWTAPTTTTMGLGRS